MNRLSKAAIITNLVKSLRENGSWAGETHIQKSIYLLQEVLGRDLGLDFILYKHGPFSFDLRDELTALRADGLLDLEPQEIPYGPRLSPTTRADQLQKRFPKTIGEHSDAIKEIGHRLGHRGVSALERLATAVYVSQKNPGVTREARIQALTEIKPHIRPELASKAVVEAEEWLSTHREK